MWILAVYLMDRGSRGAEWTKEYEHPHHAQAKARAIIRHGLEYKTTADVYLYYPIHKVDYVAIRKLTVTANLTNSAE